MWRAFGVGEPRNMRILRADLHVHSRHSLQSGNMRFLKSRDCYSRPEDVYRVAKARGMDLVTITDHDSIGGCLEFLDKHPDATDFFISEEVSCRLPQGDVEVHLGVYGLDETLHRELQPLRRDVFEVCARLRESGVFFALNHLLHFYRRQLALEAYLRLLDAVPGLESRNGTMVPAHNELVEWIVERWGGGSRLSMVGGSDAHTLRRIARTWTEAPGDDVESFLGSLRERRSRAAGVHGGITSVAGDAYGVVGRYCASLLGYGPRDHSVARRAGCLAFSLVSLPAQFVPLAIVASGKRREARQVRRVRAELSAWPDRLSKTVLSAGHQA
jgi:predicted metal-dependent phosphoesterase TrpH